MNTSKSFHKIIFAGPVGAGKTTAIKTISDTPVVHTEQEASDETKNIKSHTTVAMDYGSIILGGGVKVHLYGTPGQKRFDFMWDILSKGGIGLVLLINASDESAIDDLNFYLDSFKSFIRETTVVIGLTKTDRGRKYSLEEFNKGIKLKDKVFPIYEVDARNSADVNVLIETLLLMLDPTMADAS